MGREETENDPGLPRWLAAFVVLMMLATLGQGIWSQRQRSGDLKNEAAKFKAVTDELKFQSEELKKRADAADTDRARLEADERRLESLVIQLMMADSQEDVRIAFEAFLNSQREAENSRRQPAPSPAPQRSPPPSARPSPQPSPTKTPSPTLSPSPSPTCAAQVERPVKICL